MTLRTLCLWCPAASLQYSKIRLLKFWGGVLDLLDFLTMRFYPPPSALENYLNEYCFPCSQFSHTGTLINYLFIRLSILYFSHPVFYIFHLFLSMLLRGNFFRSLFQGTDSVFSLFQLLLH